MKAMASTAPHSRTGFQIGIARLRPAHELGCRTGGRTRIQGNAGDVRRRLQVRSYSASVGQSGQVSLIESNTSRTAATAVSGERPRRRVVAGGFDSSLPSVRIRRVFHPTVLLLALAIAPAWQAQVVG